MICWNTQSRLLSFHYEIIHVSCHIKITIIGREFLKYKNTNVTS